MNAVAFVVKPLKVLNFLIPYTVLLFGSRGDAGFVVLYLATVFMRAFLATAG